MLVNICCLSGAHTAQNMEILQSMLCATALPCPDLRWSVIGKSCLVSAEYVILPMSHLPIEVGLSP